MYFGNLIDHKIVLFIYTSIDFNGNNRVLKYPIDNIRIEIKKQVILNIYNFVKNILEIYLYLLINYIIKCFFYFIYISEIQLTTFLLIYNIVCLALS